MVVLSVFWQKKGLDPVGFKLIFTIKIKDRDLSKYIFLNFKFAKMHSNYLVFVTLTSVLRAFSTTKIKDKYIFFNFLIY